MFKMTGELESIPTNILSTEGNTNFQYFLDYLSYMDNTPLNNKQQLIYNDFKEMIKDLNRCAISGSSILAYRYNLHNIAHDIDFFIVSTPKNSKIIEDMFGAEMAQLNTAFFEKKFKCSGKPILSNNHTQGYNFTKKTFKLNTMNMEFSIDRTKFKDKSQDIPLFLLNFIFIDPELPEILLEEDYNLYLSKFSKDIYNPKAGTTRNFSSMVISDEVLKNQIQVIFPKGHSLHLIDSSFDFEELKYVYSFDFNNVITVKAAGKFLLTLYKVKIKKLLDAYTEKRVPNECCLIKEEISKYLTVVGQEINDLSQQDKNFLKNEHNKEHKTLTISYRILTSNTFNSITDIFLYVDKITPLNLKLDEYSKTDGKLIYESLGEVLPIFLTLNSRIKNYIKNGFKIEDPDLILAKCQTIFSAIQMHSFTSTGINGIVTSSCLKTNNSVGLKRLKNIRLIKKEQLALRDKLLFNIGNGGHPLKVLDIPLLERSFEF